MKLLKENWVQDPDIRIYIYIGQDLKSTDNRSKNRQLRVSS